MSNTDDIDKLANQQSNANPAETVREVMENLGDTELLDLPDTATFGVPECERPVLVSVPRGRDVIDVQTFFGERARPVRRKGRAVYPLVVRFLYRKAGPKLFCEVYDPARALDDAIDEVAEKAQFETALPMFDGLPES